VLNILGYILVLPADLGFLAAPGPAFFINMVAWIIIVLLLNFILLRGLKFFTRRIPGDLEDIILGILSRPILILVGLYGVNFAFRQLPLLPVVFKWMQIISSTIVVLIIAHILGRFLRDVLVYYGEKWAARTETQVDDVLIPVLNLFGPLLLGLVAALIILPLWGINVTSVLLGAGVLGLVLGLALQETLGNIFSGLSLLIEAPFRKGDLIWLSDGRISEVLHLGIRSTMLFSLDEQATIFIPNKVLASSMLVNLTKPTPEQRYSIEVDLSQPVNLAYIQNTLLGIANGHPAVLSSEMTSKLASVREQVDYIRRQAGRLPEGDAVAHNMLVEADKNEHSIGKLELDGKFNTQIMVLKESLRNLIRGINDREVNGLTGVERQELFCNYVSPAENNVKVTLELASDWLEARDPWVNDTDFWHQRKIWEKRNEQLLLHWERLKKTIHEVDDRREMRLDDAIKLMLEWIEKEYKIPPGYWKNPSVIIKALEGTNVHLQLCYYVDNIRLEHDTRPNRVRTELSRMIHEKLVEESALRMHSINPRQDVAAMVG
jgi:small-conductance mechanosensitive channel